MRGCGMWQSPVTHVRIHASQVLHKMMTITCNGTSGKTKKKTVTWIDTYKKETTIFFKNALCFFSFMVWLPTFGIFNMHIDVDACNFTQRLYKHGKRVCTESWLGEKSLATPGTRTRVSIAPGFSVGHSTNWAIPCIALINTPPIKTK